MRRGRSGVTMVELLVVLVILGLVMGLTAVAFHPAERAAEPSAEDRVAGARQEAIATGSAVSIVVPDSAAPWMATALPDGRVLRSRRSLGGEGTDASR